jgi:hypothetical protein
LWYYLFTLVIHQRGKFCSCIFKHTSGYLYWKAVKY